MMQQRTFNLAASPFLVLLTALIAGILFQQNVAIITGFMAFCCSLLFLALSAILHSVKRAKLLLTRVRQGCLLMAFIMLGICISNYQNPRNNPNWYGKDLKEVRALKLQIITNPVETERTVLLNCHVKSILKNNSWIIADGNIKAYIFKQNLTDTLKAGATILMPNKLTTVTSSGNPFAFDQAIHSQRNSLYHQCFLNQNQIIVFKNNGAEISFIQQLRQTIQTAIHKNVKDAATKGLIDAMLLNNRIHLDSDLLQAYATSGVVHILAISGMHVLLLAGMALSMLSVIPNKKVQQLKYFIALIIVWIYVAITGFPPSADRAAVMFSVYALGMIFNRDNNPLNTWAASGFLLLCYNPYWLYDVGAQLSFMAVLSILLFNKSIRNLWKPQQWILRKLWDGIAVSLSVQILVFPLVIYYFNQFPIFVFLANIPAGIYSTVLMMGAILIFIFHSIGLSALWIGTVLNFITQRFNAFIVLLSGWSPESFRMLFLDALDYWLMMFSIIFICIFFHYRKAKSLFSAMFFCMLLLADFIWKDIAALHQERIVVYNLNKESQVDIFRSKRVYHLYDANQQQYKYALKPAMLGFKAIESRSDTFCQHLFIINRKKVLLLKGTINPNNISFPIDVLIVSQLATFQPQQWFQTFHPKKIIIDGSFPRYKALQWKQQLQQAGAQVHCVNTDGAWIYPSL